MRILVTGHTGFKGSWLTLLLQRRGHEVAGLALDPPAGGLFERARVAETMSHDLRGDIRDAATVADAVERTRPDAVMHLAAQPLVRRSYREPRYTYETNVNGTLNVLEAIQDLPSVAAVMVTTDKVYRNVGQRAGYVEDDALGGDDPYSSSKAMADLLIQSWARSFPGPSIAIARAGNVIGGGDVSTDRLLVDLIGGFVDGRPVEIRNPDAVRPWQHVLDCLNGYALLLDALRSGERVPALNFGPDPRSFQTVREIADRAVQHWGGDAGWIDDHREHPHEAAYLTLDSSAAAERLSWHDELPFPTSLEWTLDWHRRVEAGEDARAVTMEQIDDFDSRAGRGA